MYIKDIFRSFYSADFYKNVLNNRVGFGFKHIFYLSLTISIALGIIFMLLIQSGINPNLLSKQITNNMFFKQRIEFEQGVNRILGILSSFPKVQIENNQLKTEKNKTHYIYDPLDSSKLIAFDSKGDIENEENSGLLFVFSKDKTISCFDNCKQKS